MRLLFFTAMVTFFVMGCPRPIDGSTVESLAVSGKKQSQPESRLPLDTIKGPPPLPEHLKKAMAKKRTQKKKPHMDGILHEDKLRQRSQQADMLLLTAERQRAQGNWQMAQRMCAEARSHGAGIPSIGYRPHLCVSEGFVERGMWDQVLYRFENKTQLKENWAGYADWQLLGARALIQKGKAQKAVEVLNKIKKKPEVASEAQRLLSELSTK